MMELFFDIGGSVVRVSDLDGIVDISGSMLERFQIGERAADFHLEVSRSAVLPIPESTLLFDSTERRVYAQGDAIITLVGSPEQPYLRIERRGNVSHAQFRRGDWSRVLRDRPLLQAMEAERLITAKGGLLLHSSFICHQDRAILFTAPSGTGKSTQAELWRIFRDARVINGDRSVVLQTAEGFEARGIPFCGSSGICHRSCLPLEAIVVLSQASENRISRLHGVKAFRALWEGCSFQLWNRQDVGRCAETVTALIEQVPVFHLACTPDEGAVAALESELQKLRSDYAEKII